MKSCILAAAAGCCFSGFVWADETADRLEGVAAAEAAYAPYSFQNDCYSENESPVGKAHCVIRLDAVKRGVDFSFKRYRYKIAIGEIEKNGKHAQVSHKEQVVDFLITNRFLGKTFEDCMIRRADGEYATASLEISKAVCELERMDVAEGMSRFRQGVEKPR